jgi:hypothetical protein
MIALFHALFFVSALSLCQFLVFFGTERGVATVPTYLRAYVPTWVGITNSKKDHQWWQRRRLCPTSRRFRPDPLESNQTREMESPSVAVSAPGKVLLAGGYLVLDRGHHGLVLGLNARINVSARPIFTIAGVQLTEIVVASPQFLKAQWRYGFHLTEADGGIAMTQLRWLAACPLAHTRRRGLRNKLTGRTAAKT